MAFILALQQANDVVFGFKVIWSAVVNPDASFYFTRIRIAA